MLLLISICLFVLFFWGGGGGGSEGTILLCLFTWVMLWPREDYLEFGKHLCLCVTLVALSHWRCGKCWESKVHMKSSFPKRDKRQIKLKKISSCHFAVYWTYSLLHQCFMPNRYISLFKMYLTLLTSQRGALATDARSCSLWRSLLERPPPAPETQVRDPLGVMLRTRGGLTIIV